MTWLFCYLKKYKKGYLLGSLFLLFFNLLAAYVPQLVKQAINKLETMSDFVNVNDLSKLPGLNQMILDIVLWIVLLAAIMAVFRIASRQIIFSIGRQVEFDLKKDIFNHIVTLEPSYFESKRTGDIISIISNDVQSIRGLGGFAMLNIVNTVISFAVILPIMFSLHVVLTWSFLALVPLVIFFVVALSDNIKTFQTAVQERLGEISNFIEQNLSGIHIIKAYGQEESEITRFAGYNSRLKDDYIKLVGIRSLIGPVMRVIASLGFILLLYIGGKGLINGAFSAGDFAAYSLYILRLIWPVATLGWLITIVYRAEVSQKRIHTILGIKPKIVDCESSVAKESFDKEIELKHLAAKITKGENIAIVGTIGSGKSVIAHKLMHLKELEKNEILFDGVDLVDIKLNDLRTLVNLVPQENFLFSASIAENISYAKDLRQDEIEELAKLVDIHDEIMSFPDAYETVVGERGITLSGGQRQRIAIARALALEPEVLILDDALSNLDNNSSQKTLKNILARRKGRTTVFVTHKIKIIQGFDSILVMDKLKLVEQGSHQDLIKQAGLYADLIRGSTDE